MESKHPNNLDKNIQTRRAFDDYHEHLKQSKTKAKKINQFMLVYYIVFNILNFTISKLDIPILNEPGPISYAYIGLLTILLFTPVTWHIVTTIRKRKSKQAIYDSFKYRDGVDPILFDKQNRDDGDGLLAHRIDINKLTLELLDTMDDKNKG